MSHEAGEEGEEEEEARYFKAKLVVCGEEGTRGRRERFCASFAAERVAGCSRAKVYCDPSEAGTETLRLSKAENAHVVVFSRVFETKAGAVRVFVLLHEATRGAQPSARCCGLRR